MPRDSIDFQLKDNGVINFFAGSYFTGNDGFFSLHRIFRDPNTNEITDIREIQYIYQKSDNPDYIYYKYVTPDTNNNYYSIDVNLVNSDDLCFDTEWIKFPFGSSSTLIQNIVYYYELPALAGEYALGSVDGGTGAYLFYLDIGANAQKISRVEILQMISSITNTYELPIGVAIISNGTAAVDVDYLDSISTQIQEGYAGEFDIDRNGNTFTVGTTDSHVAVIYAPEDATLLNGNNQQFSVTPVHSTVQNILIKTYIDYNNYTRKTLVYRYVYIDTIVDGGTPVRSTAHILPDSDNPNYYTDNNTPDTSGDLNFPHEYKDWTGTISYDENQTAIVYKYEVPEGSTITQDFDVTYNVTYANPNVTRYDITIDTDTTLTIYFDIITNTYTYTVNGSAVSDNSNVVVNP